MNGFKQRGDTVTENEFLESLRKMDTEEQYKIVQIIFEIIEEGSFNPYGDNQINQLDQIGE